MQNPLLTCLDCVHADKTGSDRRCRADQSAQRITIRSERGDCPLKLHQNTMEDYRNSIEAGRADRVTRDTPLAKIQSLIDGPVGWPALGPWQTYPNCQQAYRCAMRDAIASFAPYPGSFGGRGIVICGGGKYAFCAMVTIKIIRHLGCRLPIEAWGFDAGEFPDWFVNEAAGLDVTLCRADEHHAADPVRVTEGRDRGWTLKAYAIRHSAFKEVLYLDADSYPVRDPTFLFDNPHYVRFGAIFWPDTPVSGGRDLPPSTWATLGMPDRREPEVEAGQFIIDKERHWEPLLLAHWMGQHSDFYYQFDRGAAYGDKFTWHVAWRYLAHEYAMPPRRPDRLFPAMLQYKFDGAEMFVHRVNSKFTPYEVEGQYEVFSTTHQIQQRNDSLPLEAVAWRIALETRRLFPLGPRISFIISTDGRRPDLAEAAIRGAQRNCAGASEIIIVGAVQPFRDIENVTFVEASDLASKGMLAALRNAGAAVSEGDVLVFLDDDVVLPPTWLARFAAFDKLNHWRVLGNKLLRPDGERIWDRVKVEGGKTMTRADDDHLGNDPSMFLSGGLFTMRRDVSETCPWDGSIPIHARRFDKTAVNEDVELSRRLLARGIPLSFDADNTAWHYKPQDDQGRDLEACDDFKRVLLSYGCLPAFVDKPPEMSLSRIARGTVGLAKAVTGVDRADDATIARRTETCKGCEFAVVVAGVFRKCTICGCSTWAKVRNAKENCPKGKW